MKYFELFAGVGGFGIGIQQAYELYNPEITGLENVQNTQSVQGVQPHATSEHGRHVPTCIGYSEIDKYASQVLKYHHPQTKNYGDITQINWAEVSDFELLTGGSPCQDFSIAGKRAGIKGERSGLVWEYIRCLEEKKPRYFIWENVKGVLSSRRGFDFGNILTAFSQVGYDLQWQVLNAKHFGVPQNRERIFIVGHLRGTRRPEVFPFGETMSGTSKAKELREPISNCLRTNYSNGHSNETYIRKLNNPTHSNNIIYGDNGLSPSLQGMSIRRLTPKECERLMSWPDEWTRWGINDKGDTVEISNSQRYKQCGNGVCSNVVTEIVKRLIM